MRDPEIPASLLVRFFFLDPASLCGVTRFSTRHPGYTRCLYPKKTAGSTVWASRDARPVHPTSNLYQQRSMSSFPIFFSRKRKGEAKRKLPADVRKLKNASAVRGKELAGLAPQQLFNRLYRSGSLNRFTPAQTSFPLIRPSPSFFSPLSPIGRRGFVLRSCRTLMRHPGIPTRLPVRFTFLDPASRAG